MSQEVGSIHYDLDLNKSKFERGMASASAETKTFGNRLDSFFSGAVSGSKMFATGLLAISAGTVLAGTFALKSAGDMEMLRTSLDVMTGSAENGAKLFKDLYEFASKTPFETGDLAKASQTMLGFGISSEKVIPYLKMLGDVSMGNKDKLQSLTLAFSQVQSTGRLMGQDLLQMINGGFNPLTVIAKKTGKSMVDLKKDMEAGKISAEMVADAFKTATSEGGLFYKGMEKGSQTLQGLWSTLMDTSKMLMFSLVGLSETGEIIKGGLFDKVKAGVEGITKWISDNQETIKKWVENSFGWLKDNIPLITGMIVGGLIPSFIALGATLLTNPITWISLAFGAFFVIIDKIVQRLGGWDEVMKVLQPTLGAMWDWVQNKLGPAIDWLGHIVNDYVIPILMILGFIFMTYVWPAMQFVWDLLAHFLIPTIVDFWQKNKYWLIPVLVAVALIIGTLLVAGIMSAVIAFGVIFAVIGGVIWIVGKLIGLFQWLQKTSYEVGNAMGDGIARGGNWAIQRGWDVIRFFESFPGHIFNALRGVYGAITGAFGDAFNWIKSEAGKAKDSMLDSLNPFKRHSPSMVDVIQRGTGQMLKDYGSFFNRIEGMAITTRPSLQTAVANVAPQKAGGNNVNIKIDMSGIMATSQTDIREKAKILVSALNEELRAKGIPEIGV